MEKNYSMKREGFIMIVNRWRSMIVKIGNGWKSGLRKISENKVRENREDLRKEGVRLEKR